MGKLWNVFFLFCKWRLGKNVVLRLMECLNLSVSFDTFMDNYFTSFRLLTHLGVNNIRATQMHYHWGQADAKKGTWLLSTAHIKQKSSVTLTVVGQNNSSAIYIASPESCEPKRFVRCQNKRLKKYIQEQQPHQSLCYNQNMGFVNRMDQNLAKYWYPNEKMVVFPVCLNGRCCYSGCVGIVSY